MCSLQQIRWGIIGVIFLMPFLSEGQKNTYSGNKWSSIGGVYSYNSYLKGDQYTYGDTTLTTAYYKLDRERGASVKIGFSKFSSLGFSVTERERSFFRNSFCSSCLNSNPDSSLILQFQYQTHKTDTIYTLRYLDLPVWVQQSLFERRVTVVAAIGFNFSFLLDGTQEQLINGVQKEQVPFRSDRNRILFSYRIGLWLKADLNEVLYFTIGGIYNRAINSIVRGDPFEYKSVGLETGLFFSF